MNSNKERSSGSDNVMVFNDNEEEEGHFVVPANFADKLNSHLKISHMPSVSKA